MSRKQRLIWLKMMKLSRTKLIDLQKIANSPTSLFPQRLLDTYYNDLRTNLMDSVIIYCEIFLNFFLYFSPLKVLPSPLLQTLKQNLN